MKPVLTALLSLMPLTAAAASVTISPLADGYITPAVGGGLTVLDQPFGSLFAGDLSRTIVEFDLSAVPDTALISAASISFTGSTQLGTIPRPLQFLFGEGDGVVTSGDFDRAATLAETEILNLAGLTATTVDLALPGVLTGFLLADAVMLRVEAPENALFRFVPQEQAPQPPFQLTLTYEVPPTPAVPLPAAGLLLLGSLTLLGIGNRRRRH